MKILLDGLLPRLFPGLKFLCVPHEGKQDLEKSVPRKIRAWREPGVRFVVLRDNDSADCRAVKNRLATLCRTAGRDDSLVRIVCQELEAWYFGDPEALAEAYAKDRLAEIGSKTAYRNPDAIIRPSEQIIKLIPEFQKVSGARFMSKLLSRERNKSRSFHALLEGIDHLFLTLR